MWKEFNVWHKVTFMVPSIEGGVESDCPAAVAGCFNDLPSWTEIILQDFHE